VCGISELSLVPSTSIPKAAGSIPTHRGQANFSACPVWIYTQSNIKNIVIGFFLVYKSV
jgi:hypothetical protein